MNMENTVYTVFNSRGGFYSSNAAAGKRPQTLEGMIKYATDLGADLSAWAAEGTKGYGGEKDWTTLRSESIAAGRTFDIINGKHVPKGLKEAPKEEAWPFRIGGIYRQNDGNLVHLTTPWSSGSAALGVMLTGPYRGSGSGARRLNDGKYPSAEKDPQAASHLVPGEVDKDGNPLVQTSAKTGAKTAKPKQVSETSAENVAVEMPDGSVAVSYHPADVAMVKSDGLSKSKLVKFTCVDCTGCEKCVSGFVKKPKVKPAMAGLTFSSDIGNTPHLVKPFHGSAFLH